MTPKSLARRLARPAAAAALLLVLCGGVSQAEPLTECPQDGRPFYILDSHNPVVFYQCAPCRGHHPTSWCPVRMQCAPGTCAYLPGGIPGGTPSITICSKRANEPECTFAKTTTSPPTSSVSTTPTCTYVCVSPTTTTATTTTTTATSTTIVDDPCSSASNPCVNGGMCINLCGEGEGPCVLSCLCPQGFSGNRCQVIDDPCVTSDSCVNGGTCVTGGGGVPTCQCRPGYMGSRCELGSCWGGFCGDISPAGCSCHFQCSIDCCSDISNECFT